MEDARSLAIVKRLRQYIGKASFGSSSDKFSATECLDELELRVSGFSKCGHCGGTGWCVRDPDIGTDRECFVCGGSGVYEIFT